MTTIIKWPGGKSSEYKYIKELIPEYDRYIEPFFGGGAVFFEELKDKPKKRAIINDLNHELSLFYKLVKKQDSTFKNYLTQFQKNWDSMPKFINLIEKELVEVYKNYSRDKINKEELNKRVNDYLHENLTKFNGLFNEKFSINNQHLFNKISKALIAKLNRMKKIEKDKNEKLIRDDIKDNIETGFRSGFYYHFRDILNDYKLSRISIPEKKFVSIYYFIREFCYGSMFRYNQKGEFNIPYGGISYNKKDFKSKIDRLFNPEIKSIFKNTRIYSQDFEKLLNDLDLTKNDFVFLDPPYDSNFSTYGGNPFDQNDHKRLAKVLSNLDAKFIMIIKNTDFINNLYNNIDTINRKTFDKKYSYNVKGRNNRKAKHLILYNYEIKV
ncbi:MAG: DNA adenine methylase [Bacillota bacterium]